MSRPVPAAIQRLVRERASGRCEYCGLAQEGQEATFHVDHVRPVKAGGATELDNLALACVSCSLRKGARQEAIDPATGEVAPIFDPRNDGWSDHFEGQAVTLLGRTPTGRATVTALAMNRPLILAIRQEESLLGRHPRA